LRKSLTALALTAAFSVSALAADVSGFVIDQMCANNAAMRGNVECAQKCIKGGPPAMLVTEDGKMYEFSNQAKAVPPAREKVTVSGKVQGDTTISKIKAS
jgi:hypothetical protein